MKKNILLDLDQTLISAEADEEFDFKKFKEKTKLFKFKDMDGLYLVFERPYLQEFLDYLFKNFNVSIWTAASKDYALFIIEKILLQKKPDRKLDYIFFSYHCDLSDDKKRCTKDLDMLWDEYKLSNYNKNNTFILDDLDEVHDVQKNNCIVAPAFEFQKNGSENDTFLKDLLPHLDKLKNDEIVNTSKINKEMKSN
jgi:TFIIF-interacting CTD phosphatase-like protein